MADKGDNTFSQSAKYFDCGFKDVLKNLTLVEFKKTEEKIEIQPLTTMQIKGLLKFEKLTKIERKEFLRTKFGEKRHLIINADMAPIGLSSSDHAERYSDYLKSANKNTSVKSNR